jgi:S-adenosylmethionine/arginine decarboxylase-like enzyme
MKFDYFKEIERLRESEELAWGLIANAYGGDWDLASEASGWKAAAERWRDDYYATSPSPANGKPMDTYGKELILDLGDCNPETFTRESITEFFTQLCELIGMEQCDLHFWDDVGVSEDECQTDPNLKGTSAVQFIMTSSIVIHCLDLLGTVYLNLFSCKDFDIIEAIWFARNWFKGNIVKSTEVPRI